MAMTKGFRICDIFLMVTGVKGSPESRFNESLKKSRGAKDCLLLVTVGRRWWLLVFNVDKETL